MRKIVNSTYVTLDGVVENPHLWPPTGDDAGESEAIQTELLMGCDAVLMGRRTYEGFAPVWTTRSGDPYSDRINTMPKYVVSTTMIDPDWSNTTVVAADVVETIAQLKSEPGQDIVQYGFGRLSRTLVEHGLIDELRLWVHPFMVGEGSAEDLLFRESVPLRCELAAATTLASGIVILSYRVG